MSIQLHRKIGIFFDAKRDLFRKILQMFTWFYLSILLLTKFTAGNMHSFTTYEEIMFSIVTAFFSLLIVLKNDGYFEG